MAAFAMLATSPAPPPNISAEVTGETKLDAEIPSRQWLLTILIEGLPLAEETLGTDALNGDRPQLAVEIEPDRTDAHGEPIYPQVAVSLYRGDAKQPLTTYGDGTVGSTQVDIDAACPASGCQLRYRVVIERWPSIASSSGSALVRWRIRASTLEKPGATIQIRVDGETTP